MGEGEEMEGGDGKEGSESDAGKTKIMWCRASMGQAEDSGESPCGACRKGVGDSYSYAWSVRWVHKRCSGISGKLKVMWISTAGGVWRVRMASYSQFC